MSEENITIDGERAGTCPVCGDAWRRVGKPCRVIGCRGVYATPKPKTWHETSDLGPGFRELEAWGKSPVPF